MIVGILVLYLVLEEMHPGFHHWVGLLHMGLIILRYVPFMGCPGTAKVTLKLKKVGKTTRWFTYDLNPIPYDYTVEVTHRFKGLDLIDRVREELWTEVCNTVQDAVIKTIPKKNKCKKAKWLSEEALQVAEKRREVKGKEKRKDISIWIQSAKEYQGEIRKPSPVINAKKWRKRIEWERLEISSRKSEIPRGHFMQRWVQ